MHVANRLVGRSVANRDRVVDATSGLHAGDGREGAAPNGGHLVAIMKGATTSMTHTSRGRLMDARVHPWGVPHGCAAPKVHEGESHPVQWVCGLRVGRLGGRVFAVHFYPTNFICQSSISSKSSLPAGYLPSGE